MADRVPTTRAGLRVWERYVYALHRRPGLEGIVTLGLIAQVEDEARRAFLDELITAGFIQASIGLSYNELEEALARHRLRLITALHAQTKGQEIGGTDG